MVRQIQGEEMVTEVTIYTDDSCSPNPGGPGGYACILICGKHRVALSGGYKKSTNNRMELMAAIKALGYLTRRCSVTLYSDSQYVTNGVQRAYGWCMNEWRTKAGTPAKNRDLWEQLLALCEEHEVDFQWVRGHNGTLENEICDRLAGKAAKGFMLAIDEGYQCQR